MTSSHPTEIHPMDSQGVPSGGSPKPRGETHGPRNDIAHGSAPAGPISFAGRSPTLALIGGLVVTLLAVALYSIYINRQISGLRDLQNNLIDRNRKDSIELLRIQGDLNSLGLAMRDILDNSEPYPLTAWVTQFQHIRADLDAAIQSEQQFAPAGRIPEQKQYLATEFSQFWNAVDRMFALAQTDPSKARDQIRLSLQARQQALAGGVARLLIQNSESEAAAALQVQTIYSGVQTHVYVFLAVTLTAILLTSIYLIYSNRRLFAQLAALSHSRSELARHLIATQESTLRHVSRELHDEFGQILTALGSLLGRSERQAPEGSSLRNDLCEIRGIAQVALEKVRSVSQALHPVMIESAGLDDTISWYLPVFERQAALKIHYEKCGQPYTVSGAAAIHIYRVLQEALNNVMRHAQANAAWVYLRYAPHELELQIEDDGVGLSARPSKMGIGMVAMRERAELLGGGVIFGRSSHGGALIRLRIPADQIRTDAAQD